MTFFLKNEVHDRSQSFFKQPKELRGTNKRDRKPKTRIKPISDKKKEANKIYEKVVSVWAETREKLDGFKCQYPDCKNRADSRPHHAKGRIGKLLYDPKLFRAVCKFHHRFLHENPAIGYSSGLMIKRI